ncbi:unnamed protein product [Cylindrotheca closterium]|uniref:Uncharacterized protein n=1 Tax=Cylindrotheca closterium TaxID=2856 RepID=A0AAD2FUK2_9STRA|nr:unnamed protein product [Cylindrotheca closterium]
MDSIFWESSKMQRRKQRQTLAGFLDGQVSTIRPRYDSLLPYGHRGWVYSDEKTINKALVHGIETMIRFQR